MVTWFLGPEFKFYASDEVVYNFYNLYESCFWETDISAVKNYKIRGDETEVARNRAVDALPKAF